jgi:hypothetical protein
MIQLSITRTGKSYNPRDSYRVFDHELKTFPDMSTARTFLLEEYQKARKMPMYQDDQDGKSVQIGYVFGFRADDISHIPVEKWLQQDWVEFREVKTLNIGRG